MGARSRLGSYTSRVATAAAVCVLAAPAVARASAFVDLVVETTRVEVGRPFRVRYSVHVRSESDPDVTPLNFGSLQLMSDPNPPSLPNFFGGGPGFSVSLDTSTDYVVRALAPGRYVISNARVVDRRTGRSIGAARDVVIDAVGNAPGLLPSAGASAAPSAGSSAGLDPNTPPPPPPDPDAPPEGDLTGALYNPTAFLRAAVSNPRPWLGQQVTFRAWLYTASAEANCEVTDEPSFQGFWNESLLPPSRECAAHWFSTNVAGRFMAAGLVRRVALFPTQAGRLMVGRVAATADVLTGGLFRGLQRTETRTPELTLEVREPPVAGRPAEYVPGTVGPLELAATLDRPRVSTGETAVLTVTVQSPNSLAALRVRPPSNVDGLRVRDGDVRLDHGRDDRGVVSALRADFLLVPERAGSFSLGALRIPYWNAETERYAFAEATLPVLTADGAAIARESAGESDPLAELRGFGRAPSLEPARWIPGAKGSLVLVFALPTLLVVAAGARAGARRVRARVQARRAAREEDPRAHLAEAQRVLEAQPGEALSHASRALDRALRAARESAREGASLPGEIQAVREARAALEAARFAGAPTGEGAREVLGLVARAVDALEAYEGAEGLEGASGSAAARVHEGAAMGDEGGAS